MESLYLLILVFFIVLIIFHFSFNIEVFYDLYLNDGYFFVKIWKIPLKRAKLKAKGRNIIIIEKRKNEDFELELSQEQIKFLQTFFNEVKNKIKIRKIEIESETGVDDPFYSAIFSGAFNSLISAFFARLKNTQPTAFFKLNNNTNFFEFVFKVKIFSRISISIFDIIYALFISVLSNKKEINLKNIKKT